MISKQLAKLLLDGRNSYDYPAAFIAPVGIQPPDLQVGAIQAVFNPGTGTVTSLLLDAYHHSLLTATASTDQQRLGVLSAIYWGYITYSDQFARVRAGRHLSKTSVPALATALSNSAADIIAGKQGAAIGCLGGIPELNRLPFASKIIAFLAPDTAGVYDNRINSFIADHQLRLCDSRFSPVPRHEGMMSAGGVASRANQLRYQIWCEFLIRLRDDMNQLGSRWRWKSTEPTSQSWRAVDIERAIFSFTKQSRSVQSQAAEMLNDYCSA
jgi:hypothetical protein